MYVHIVCNYTPCESLISVLIKHWLLKFFHWKLLNIDKIVCCVDDWLGYMQSETYTTVLFLPGMWILYPASFSLVEFVAGFIIQAQSDEAQWGRCWHCWQVVQSCQQSLYHERCAFFSCHLLDKKSVKNLITFCEQIQACSLAVVQMSDRFISTCTICEYAWSKLFLSRWLHELDM